jgi:hypothetical protein
MKVIRMMALALAAIVALCISGCNSCHPASRAAVGAYAPSSALLVPAWYIDPANSTGCASDTNTGTSATCTGGPNGPLKSWYGLNSLYWNCTGQTGCPRLRQNTTITFLSSHTDNTDPVRFLPSIENGAIVVLQAQLPTTFATGTTGTVTPKNRATPQLLASTFSLTGPALAAGQLVVDATHAARAWVYTTGSPNALSTAMAPASTTTPSPSLADNSASVANGDAVNVYTPIAVNLVEVSPLVADYNGGFNNQLVVYQITALDPSGISNDNLYVGGGGTVFFFEDSIQRIVQAQTNQSADVAAAFVNCDFAGGLGSNTVPGTSATLQIRGGQVRSTALSWQAASVSIDGDIILGKNAAIAGGGFGTVYVDTGKTLSFQGGAAIANSVYNSGVPVVWGPGTVNASGASRVQYPSGAAKAAATFVGVTLNANGQTKGCLMTPGGASSFGTCNVVLAAATLDTNLGATSGCYGTGGASFCNFGP